MVSLLHLHMVHHLLVVLHLLLDMLNLHLLTDSQPLPQLQLLHVSPSSTLPVVSLLL
jgi:hypothetical protein